MDAIKGSCTPDAQACLDNLTRCISLLLSGKVDVSISPWLSGAPLTALNKKSGGIRSIAIEEVIRRLVSRICCTAAAKPRLQEVFLPYGQVGAGVSGGLEAAIHTLKSYITTNSSRENLCCLKS